MQSKLLALAILLSTGCFGYTQASAQPSLPRNDRIIVDYQDPIDPAAFGLTRADAAGNDKIKKMFTDYEISKPVFERFKERKVLERYAQFLVPLKLPTTLRLIAKQCDSPNAYFMPAEKSINLCYNYVSRFVEGAPTDVTPDGISPDDALLGGIVATLLHETGHALFFLYQIPVLGREEDAADQIAAYVMLQFGDQVASTVVKGSLWKWRGGDASFFKDGNELLYSDVHSTSSQRFATFLCIAYGGKPSLFKRYIDANYLPAARAEHCKEEYEQVERAFVKTILPYIDRDMMSKVQSAKWFSPQDNVMVPVQTR